MARVDRNVLRLAVFELKWRRDIPKKVTLNEAVELGKAFGTEASSAFVNGLLDRIALDVEQQAVSADRQHRAAVAGRAGSTPGGHALPLRDRGRAAAERRRRATSDWRLCGQLSRLLVDGFFKGNAGRVAPAAFRVAASVRPG